MMRLDKQAPNTGFLTDQIPIIAGRTDGSDFNAAFMSVFEAPQDHHISVETELAKERRLGALSALEKKLTRNVSELREKLTALEEIDASYRERLRIIENLTANIDCGIFRFRRHTDGVFHTEYCSDRTWKLIGLFSQKDKVDPLSFPDRCLAADKQNFLDAVRTALSRRRSMIWEGEAIIDGRVRFLRIKLMPDSSILDALVYNGTIEDITEEREEKEKLRSLLDAVDQLSGHIIGFHKIVREPMEREADIAFQSLSARETQVANLILQGLSNKEIADRLFISESTTKKHLTRIFEKLEIGSRGELFHRARRIS